MTTTANLGSLFVASAVCMLQQLVADGTATARSGHEAQLIEGSIVRASMAGAALDTNLLSGGGTDDTAALQRALDNASSGRAVHLIIDGPALVSGLDVYGHTTIECTAGGGLYLKENSDRAIIRNVHRSRSDTVDEHITISGCFLNGNRDRQRSIGGSRYPTANQQQDGTYKSGLQFFGVNYLTVENVTLWNIRSFGVWVANAKVITIRDVIVDSRFPPFPETASSADKRRYLDGVLNNDDGLHFNGPIQYLLIDGLKVRTGDDGIGLNANDAGFDDMTVTDEMGPYVGQGPILDVTVRDVMFMDCLLGIRLLSTDQRIDRVVIGNLLGVVRYRMAILSHHINRLKSPHMGNFGSVTFNDVNVQPANFSSLAEMYPDVYQSMHDQWDIDEEGEVPLFSINSQVEHLSLNHVVVKAIDERPLIRIGREAFIQTVDASLSVRDPLLLAVPLKVVRGGQIERLNLSIDWRGKGVDDPGRSAIRNEGGTIRELHWMNTPPQYMSAELDSADPHIVVVKFSQHIKANDLMRGVTIRIGGENVPILYATKTKAGDTVRYQIGKARCSGPITLEYDAAKGSIANFSGDQMLSVGEMFVSFRHGCVK